MLGYLLHQVDREALAKAYAEVVEETGRDFRAKVAEIMKPSLKQRIIRAQRQGRIMGVVDFSDRIGP